MIRDVDDFLMEIEGDSKYNPCDYQYWKNLKKRRIVFNEECTDVIVEKVLLPLQQFVEEDAAAPIEIVINTLGGNYYEAFVLCNYIETIKTPLTLTILGTAMSTGIYLAMAGKSNPNVTRRCYPFSIGLIHNGYQSTSGTLSQCKEAIDFSNRYEEMVKEYVLRNTNISSELYDKNYKNDWYLSSKDMLNYGIVDNIIS